VTWAFLDDHADENPKLLAVGAEAAWYFACGLCYCRRNETVPGFIPAGKALVLYPVANVRRVIRLLVEAKLWDAVDGGYEVHHYGQVYGRPEAVTGPDLAAKRAEAGRLGGLAKASKLSSKPPGKTGSKTVGNCVANWQQNSGNSARAQDARRIRSDSDTKSSDPSSTDLSGSPAREGLPGVEDDRPDRRSIKPKTSPLTMEDYSGLELDNPGLTREFADAALADWLAEPADPKLELFGRQWRTTAIKVARSAFRDQRRRREIQSAMAGSDGTSGAVPFDDIRSAEGFVR